MKLQYICKFKHVLRSLLFASIPVVYTSVTNRQHFIELTASYTHLWSITQWL